MNALAISVVALFTCCLVGGFGAVVLDRIDNGNWFWARNDEDGRPL